MSNKTIAVKVAVRSRPLVPREQGEGCSTCLQFVPGEPQVILGTNKAFTFDYVFNPNSSQCDVYEKAASGLVQSIFKGYNATVLAYGQTGSGKTYTMGGGYDLDSTANEDIIGIIPRVIRDLYEGFHERKDYNFTAKVSYIELYKEDLFDLLVPKEKRNKDTVQVREDINGGIRLVGLQEVEVADEKAMMACLERGAAGRTTGATAMNTSSSRSHAIFTVHVERTSKTDSNDYFKAKFHLVDLAGSERQKKTRAEGERLKEGININKGLLALGNVISALGEDSGKPKFVPYRDSKLTRLLQDSLGGNSHTLMIACISPADSNMEETLSTLRYADRARKIKNKPIVNRDPQAAEIMRLRQLVQQLQQTHTGKLANSITGEEETENVRDLKDQIKKLQDENTLVSLKLRMAVNQNAELHEKLMLAEEARDSLREKLDEIKHKNSLHISMLQQSIQCDIESSFCVTIDEQKKLLDEMEAIQTTINEMESQIKPPEEENEDEDTQQGESLTLDEEQRAQTMKQVKNMEQLNDLERQIKSKEIVIKQIMQGDVMMKQYEEERRKFEDEIEKLQKERTELMEKVHEAKSNPAASKISEQRRKRLQEVEGELTRVKRKLTEQAKLLKLKEMDEKRYQKISAEIKELKQARVRMIKQIQEDAKNFAKWRMEKEKEVLQLKAKDRKQQIEMVKIKEQSQRQQAVLKRKAQEAEAANKRLKEAMAKQKSAMAERMSRLDRQDQPTKDKVKKWLIGDLELAVSLEEARHHMNQLIQDRKDLSQQLTQLRERLGTPTFKKKKLNNHSSYETCDHEIITLDIKEVERDLELRNAQIADIQQKLIDADQDEKSRARWHGIHTLSEAKVVMNQLFSTAVSSKVAEGLKAADIEDANQKVAEANKAVEEAKEEATAKVRELQEEIDSLSKHYNGKVLALLGELNSKSPQSPEKVDKALLKRLELQQKEIEHLGNLQEELDKKTAECRELQKELTVLKYSVKTGKSQLMPEMSSTSFFTPPQIPKRRSRKRKSEVDDIISDQEDMVEQESRSPDNPDLDPDWRSGFTPNPAKILKKAGSVSHGVGTRNELSSPGCCSCKGTCSNKRCSCVGKKTSCSESCSCKDAKCKNREIQHPESTTDDSQLSLQESHASAANTTFILDGSDAAESTSLSAMNSTFVTEPKVAHTDKKEKAKPSKSVLSEVFSQENIDLDSSDDFENKQKELKNDATILEQSGIMKISKLNRKGASYFGKL